MTTYTDVFGSDAVPSTLTGYAEVTLSANTQFYWPEVSSEADLVADIMDVTASGTFNLIMPPANQVSEGRNVLINNVGAETFYLVDAEGGAIATLSAGQVNCVYLVDNSTVVGSWRVFTFGTGTSSADASALVGFGTTVLESKIATNCETVSQPSDYAVLYSDRSKILRFSSTGELNCYFPQASTLGNGFLVGLSNQGMGSVVVNPYGSETVDGELTKSIAPGESAFFVCGGDAWVSVGYGRSTQFQFTKLVLDITTGSPFTLSSVQAQNKLLQFIGTAGSNVVINVPSVVGVYYVQCSYSGAFSLTIKTAAGLGVVLTNADRAIVYCDGVDVVLAQTSSAPTTDLAGGVAGAIVYQSAPNETSYTAAGIIGEVLESAGAGTPIWKNIGVLLNGLTTKATPVDVDVLAVGDSAASFVGKKFTIANLKTLIKSYYDSATATLTGKTINLSNNTLTGTGAQFDTACSDQNFLFESDLNNSVQAYDANTAKTDVAQNFTLPQRSSLLTDNDGSFDLAAKQNFKCTTAGNLTLTFTNRVDGLSGSVIFINSSNHTISAHTSTKLTAADLAKLSASGTYRIDYLTDGTNAYCSVVGAYL